MDEEKKIGYVTDVDKNNLSETVKEKNLSDEIFEKFDQEIEDSFQKFLQELKSNLTGKEKPEDLQERFNEWLEKNIAQLDELMEDNIAIQVVKDSELKLVGFNTVNEILNLEDEVEAEQKNKTKETVEVEIKGDQLKMTTFNNINPNAIAKLFNENNFKKEDELLNLLKTAKRKKDYSSDEVRKFQRIIVGIENPDSNAEDSKYKGNDSPLKRYGIDGKFGKETLEAFEQYVKKYPENTNSGTGAQGSEQTETGTQIIGGGTPKVGVGTPGIDQQETGEKGPVTTTTETETSNTDMEFLRELSDKTTLDEDLAKEIIAKGINKELTLQKLEKITEDGAKIIKDYKGTLIVPHLTELPKEILKTLWDGENLIVEFQKGNLKKDNNGNRIIEMNGVDEETYNTLDKITQDVCNSLINKTVEEEPTKDKKNKKDKNRKRKNKGNKEEKNGDDKTEVVVPTSTNNNQNTDNQIITEGGPKGGPKEEPKEQSEGQREDPKIAEFEKEIGERTSLDDKGKAKKIIETLGEKRENINLPKLESISKEAAEELKKYNGKLVVTALTELSLEIIQTFWDNSKTTIEFSNGKLITKDDSRIIETNNPEGTYKNLDKIDTKVCNLLIGKPAEETVEQPVVEAPAVKKPESSTTNVNGSSEVVVTNTENTERIDGEGQHSSTNETIETENKEVLLQKAKQLKEVLKDADVEHKNAGIMLFLMCGKFDTFISDNSEQIAEKFNKYYKECINELKEKGLEDIVTILNNYKFGSNYNEYHLLSGFITLTGGEEFYQKYNNLTTDKEKHNLLYKKIDEYKNTRGSIIEFVYTPDPVPTKEGNTDVKQPVTQVVKPVTVEQPEKVAETTEEGGKMSEEEINEIFEYLKEATEGISEEEFSNLIQSLESSAPECITTLRNGEIKSLQKKYAGDTSTGIIPGEVVSRTAGLPQFGINGILNRETYNLLMGIDDINDINSIKGTIKSDMFVDESFNLKNEIIKNDDKGNYIQVQGQKYYEAKDENISGLYYKKTDNSFELGYFENGQLNGRGIKSEYNGKLINGDTKDWNTDIPDDNKNNTNKDQNNNVEKPEPDPIEQFQKEINDLPSLNEKKANEIMEKLRDQENIRLDKLEEITVPVANILKDYNKTLIVNGLKELSPEVLKIFWDSGITIEFKQGVLKKDKSGNRIIANKDGFILCQELNKIDNNIHSQLCKYLIGKDVEENGDDNSTGTNGNGNTTDTNLNNNQAEKKVKLDDFVEHGFEGVGYNVDKAEGQVSTDKDAIQRLTVGSGFGRGYNSELSIVDDNYAPYTQEYGDLANLKTYLLECTENPVDIFQKIDNKIKDFGKNEKLNKLYDLYRECINDQYGNKKGPYLKRVIRLLRKYFVTGVYDENNNKIGTFKDMYNNELIGKAKNIETKKRKAKKALSAEEKALLKERDGDFVNAVNTGTQLSLPSDTFKPYVEKYGFSSPAEAQFAMCLCDLNANGKIDSADIDTKTGQELFNMIKDAKIDQKYGIIEKGPMQNILGYAKEKAKNDGYTNTAAFLEEIDLSSSDDDIMKKIKERPLTMQYLRLMLVNCPMNSASDIIHTGLTTIDGGEKVTSHRSRPNSFEYFYAQETNESIKNYADRLYSGKGMHSIENFVSKDGYITEKAINYLNEKLSILSPNGIVPKIVWDQVEGSEPGISLKIPKELLDYVNIPYDPNLGKYIKYDDEYFEIPANIKIGLLTYSRLYTGKYNLILGSYERGENFKLLGKTDEFTGEPSKHEGEPGKSIMTESKINKELESLLNNENFPLSGCREIKDGLAYFKIKDGKSFIIKNNEKLGIDNNLRFFVPEHGMLILTKTDNVTYAEFNDSVKDKLTVQYIDEDQPNENEEKSIDVKDIFDKYEDLNNMFTEIEESLSTLDDEQFGNYASFMNFASDVADEDALDATDYEKAFNELKNMLSVLNEADLEDTNLNALKQKIEEGDLKDDEKMLIVDRFKMLFSYHIDLSKGDNNGEYLSKITKKRGLIYEGLKGYDTSVKFPLTGQKYREKIVDQLKDKSNLDKKVYPNLIGMTAFYRLGKGHTGRSYMMTEMGKTTVLGNTFEELTDANLESAKNWFIANLNKSDIHREVLRATLTEKFKSMLNIEKLELSNENLETLLKGEELDIGTKIIRINAKYMFYLLGECGNESIGVNLDQIVVKEKGTTIDVNPDTSYNDSVGVAVDSVGAEGMMKSTTVPGSMVPAEHREEEQPDEPRPWKEYDDHQENGDTDNPRSNPQDGDGSWSGPQG